MAVARATLPHQAVERWLLQHPARRWLLRLLPSERLRPLNRREKARELKRLRAITPSLSLSLSRSLSLSLSLSLALSEPARSCFFQCQLCQGNHSLLPVLHLGC